MKHTIFLLFFSLSLVGFAQNIIRTEINGKIVVENSDIEGISIYNKTTKKGTVTNTDGQFVIAVAVNDILEIKSLEYQNFDLMVNQTNIDTKQLKIYLIQETNILDEVVVFSNKLSGDIKKDITKTKVFTPNSDAFYFGVKPKPIEIESVSPTAIDNDALNIQDRGMVNGLNVINVVDQLLIPLFRSEVEDKNTAGVPEVPVKSIKYYLGSDYLVNNFNIPEYRVEEFIRFVESEGFDFNLLNYGHEMEFLEVLHKKSILFLNKKK